jgi:pyruvate/2-oxoglutarate dehydrogenase complex dihydrolipoamide acyltransferase (E2) component
VYRRKHAIRHIERPSHRRDNSSDFEIDLHQVVAMREKHKQSFAAREGPMMMASLTFDHRVIDGEGGAKWLAEFKRILENWTVEPT